MRSFVEFGILLPPGVAGEVDVTCPQCSAQRRNKRARCLSVNVELGVWTCHHCGWRGTLQQGQQAAPTRIVWRRPDPITTAPAETARTWLYQRGITDAVIERNRLGMVDAYMPQIERNVRCVVFPYYRSGELVNQKYRAVTDKLFRLEAHAERVLYGYDDIHAEMTIVVEGEMDKLAVEVAGFPNCVSVPDGAPTLNAKATDAKFVYLDNLPDVTQWTLAVDNDEAGRRLEAELVRRFGVERCRQVAWPAGVKDANDVLLALGAEALRQLIETAAPVPIEGVYTIADRLAELKHLYERGFETGVLIGLPDLDRLFSVAPGQLTVITGHPGQGKSHLADYFLVRLATLHGWCCAIFSPENLPLEAHMARYLERLCSKPFGNLDDRMPWHCVEELAATIGNQFYWIAPNEDEAPTIDLVLARAASLVSQKGIRVLLIDPFNELESSRPQHQSETEYIGDVLRRIKAFARKRGVHVFVVVHPAKQYRNKDGSLPEMSLYDISGSAHFYNKCDAGLIVYRDAYTIRIVVAKVRFREIGRRGETIVVYDPATGCYLDAEHVSP
jgi:twinkle protein